MMRHGPHVLTLATLGLFVYGAYAVAGPIVDFVRGPRLELWAELGTIGFGLLLALSAAFVRVRVPGGLLLALGAMLGLQALAVHAAAHFATGLLPQIVRAVVATGLLGLAVAGNRVPEPLEREERPGASQSDEDRRRPERA